MADFLVMIPTANPANDFSGAIFAPLGTLPQDVTALTNGTEYEAHNMSLSDPSTPFTPAAATGISRTFLGAGSAYVISQSVTTDIDFSAVAENDLTYLLVAKTAGAQSTALTGVTLEGVSATLVGETSPTVGRAKCYIYKIDCPAAAAGNATASIDCLPGGVGNIAAAYLVSATPTTETPTLAQHADATDPIVGNVNTVDGGAAFGVMVKEDTSAGIAWVGLTEDVEVLDAGTLDRISFASAEIVATETPRTINATHGAVDGNDHGALAVLAVS